MRTICKARETKGVSWYVKDMSLEPSGCVVCGSVLLELLCLSCNAIEPLECIDYSTRRQGKCQRYKLHPSLTSTPSHMTMSETYPVLLLLQPQLLNLLLSNSKCPPLYSQSITSLVAYISSDSSSLVAVVTHLDGVCWSKVGDVDVDEAVDALRRGLDGWEIRNVAT